MSGATAPLALDPAALPDLLGPHKNHIDVAPSVEGGYVLRGGRYVGVISAPGIDLLITPKVDPVWANLGSETRVLEIIASALAWRVRHLIMRGLHHAYVEQDEQLPFVRGRLLISETIVAGRGLAHRPVCRHTPLTADVAVNQTIAAGVELLSRLPFRNSGVCREIAWIRRQLLEAGVEPDAGARTRVGRLNRLNQHYDAALRLANLVLDHMLFRLDVGHVSSPSFLVNMDAVFQEYLSELVSREASRFGLSRMAAGQMFLDEKQSVRIKPDIVLGRATRLAVAIDAKYKVESPEGDVYQALAYAKALNLQRVALVYPADGEVQANSIHVRHDQVEILVRTIPVGSVGGGFADLDERASQATRLLIEELLPPAIAHAAA